MCLSSNCYTLSCIGMLSCIAVRKITYAVRLYLYEHSIRSWSYELKKKLSGNLPVCHKARNGRTALGDFSKENSLFTIHGSFLLV